MSTRKIKDAKDLSTNELIYFKGHAQATYMSDGSTVEDAINNIEVGTGADLSAYATKTELNSKQDTLVSGTNIKTINGESILGEGNITIEGGSSDTYYLELPLGEDGQCLSSGTLTQEQFEEMASCKTLIVRTSNMSSDGVSASEYIAFDWRAALILQSDESEMKSIICSNIYPNPFNNCLTLYIFIFSSNGSECIYELIAKLIFLDSDIFDPTAVHLSDKSIYELNIPDNTESGEISEEEFNLIISSKTLILNVGMHKIVCIQRTAPEVYPDTYYFYGNFFEGGELKIGLSLLRRDGMYIYTIQTKELSSGGTIDTSNLATKTELNSKQDTITDLEVIRQGAAKGATALQSYTEQYKGTVTSITINGSSKSPSNGIIDLGTVITAHQDISGKQDTLVSGTNIKTINGESILGNGDINIENVLLGYSTLETIALYDIVYETNGEIKSIGKDNWNSNLGTLVGLVVIPKDCSPDGKARMISLQNTSLQDLYRFSNNPDLQVTILYMLVPVTDNEGSTSIGSNAYGYLPSDRFTNEQSYVDEYAKYSENLYLIPSPYCTNLGANYFNPDYALLVFSNFNGLESSKTLLSYTPVSKCLNHYNNGFSWYLPSIGELGFLMSRFQELNNILLKLNKPLLKDGAYCSSSTISFDRFMGLNTIYGEVISMSCYDLCFIIPFTIL